MTNTEPISSRSRKGSNAGCLLVFWLLFLLMGGGFFFPFFALPTIKTLQAQSWTRTPCTIISSQVRSHSGDGTTYSVDILYSYRVNGEEYQSNRYDFLPGSSSGYGGKQAIVSRYPPGARTVCYVNPRAPTQAVLSTGFRTDYLFGLIPLLFFIAGLVGIISILRGQQQKAQALPRSAWLPAQDAPVQAAVAPLSGTTHSTPRNTEQASSSPFLPAAAAGHSPGEPVTLRPTQSRLGGLITTTFAAIFWNGIVSVFVWQLYREWQSGPFNGFYWFLAIFLIPFVLVGLVLAGGIIYCFLALFIPRPTLFVNSDTVPLGGALDLQWQLSGGVVGVRRLHITLEGREEATYTRGTDTITDKNTFFSEDIFDTVSQSAMQSGQQKVVVPNDLMHSFESRHNKIIWSLKVEGSIPLWPDIKEEYKLVVLPHAASPGQRGRA